MAKSGSDTPFPLSEMMTQGFEQTRRAMESYLDFFEKTVKASPWLDPAALREPLAKPLLERDR